MKVYSILFEFFHEQGRGAVFGHEFVEYQAFVKSVVINYEIFQAGQAFKELAPGFRFMLFVCGQKIFIFNFAGLGIFNEKAEQVINIAQRIRFNVKVDLIADRGEIRLAKDHRLAGGQRFGLIAEADDFIERPVFEFLMEIVGIYRRELINRPDTDLVEPALIALTDPVDERDIAAALGFGKAERIPRRAFADGFQERRGVFAGENFFYFPAGEGKLINKIREQKKTVNSL